MNDISGIRVLGKFVRLIVVANLSSQLHAMCAFKHNPPIVCMKGKIIKKIKLKDKGKILCQGQMLVSSMTRPANTYAYNDNLDLVTHEKTQALPFDKKKEQVVYFSGMNCSDIRLGAMEGAFEYSCSDKYAKIPDHSLVYTGKKQGKFMDPWKRQYFKLRCD